MENPTPAAIGGARAPGAAARLVLGFAAAAGAVFLLTRVALIVQQRQVLHDGPFALLAALAMGEVHDLLVAAWLVLPLALYLILVPARVFRWRAHQVLLWTGIGAAIYGLCFLAVVEWSFFAELGGRFNFVAVDYLVYPTEVVSNVWESYPVAWVLAALLLPAALAVFALRRGVTGAPLERRRLRVALALGVLAVVAGGTWAASPEWGDVSSDRVLDDVARNGLFTFFGALRGSYASYDGLYATLPRQEVFRRLHGLLAERADEPGTFAPASSLRRVHNAGPARPLNVVVVLEESLGSEFVGALRRGPERSLTPHLDALARQGTLLVHAYSTGNRTIRAIEATTAGVPPLPGISLVRRPQSHDLFTLPALLRERGYRTLFVYGGRALFDGMGGYLGRNGVDRIVDQADYPPGTFATAWGVADEAIFHRSLREMDAVAARGRPFYSLVLTVSNHRPFQFPQDHVRRDPALSGRENAVRYADWALGGFMSEARARSWFRDTLFVLMGDHGARVYGEARIPLASYEVPILFIGPGVPAGERVTTLASSLDVPPTVLGVLGLDYESRFFGRDVLRLPAGVGRALMTHNADVALLEGDRMAVLGLQGATNVYDCDLAAAQCERPDASPAAGQVVDDAIAYYRGADLLYRGGGLQMPATRLVHAGAAIAAAGHATTGAGG
ncbi:MAG TPA: LTA synthase family protein [Thermoanaerobaculia bacterium]|nr:LTA synthase family protein [Thermoanaerobaculia bacterium]